jgi:hypothetical protein
LLLGFEISGVLAGVLVLSRPSAREDGTSRKPGRARNFACENPK